MKTNVLKGIIVSNGLTQRKISQQMNIAEKTFYSKMKKGVFSSSEIKQIIQILNLKDAVEIVNIFFEQ